MSFPTHQKYLKNCKKRYIRALSLDQQHFQECFLEGIMLNYQCA